MTACRETASPRPRPFALPPVSKGWKRRSRISGAIPGPVSLTLIKTESRTGIAEIRMVPPSGMTSSAFTHKFTKTRWMRHRSAPITRFSGTFWRIAQRLFKKFVQSGERGSPANHIPRGFSRGDRWRRTSLVGHRRHKLITPLRQRLNKCRLVGSVTQYLSDFQDVLSDAFRQRTGAEI